jgi:hypothetical protein
VIARRSISFVIAVALFLVAGTIAIAGPGEGTFVSKINADRAADGLDPLAVLPGLTTYARSHSEEMAADGQIYHSTSDELRSMANSAAPGWQRLGENVGVGGSVDSLHAAFMNSAGHRANILGDYTHVGIGTVEGNGRLYVTEIFVKLPASSTTTTTTTTSTTTTTTTTTAPETTTTSSTTTTTTTEATTTTTAPPSTTDGSTAPSTTEPPPTTEATTTTDTPSTTEPPTTSSSTPATSDSVPTTTTSSTTTASTGATTTAAAPTSSTAAPPDAVSGSGSIPTSGPNAPGAAATVRLVAGIVLGATVVLFLLAVRRRGGIPLER